MIEKQHRKAPGFLAGLGWRSVMIAGAAAATGIVALIALGDPAPQDARYAVVERQAEPAARMDDPLHAELSRCRTLAANSDDAGCRNAWEATRRRFMGESRSFVAPAKPMATVPPVSGSAAPAPDSQAGER